MSAVGLTIKGEPITDESLRVGCSECLEIGRLSDCRVTWRVVGEYGQSHVEAEYLCPCGQPVLTVGPRFEFTEGIQLGEWMVVPNGWMEIEQPS
jgi:hypothetical protein